MIVSAALWLPQELKDSPTVHLNSPDSCVSGPPFLR
jgi:hypothetical protein